MRIICAKGPGEQVKHAGREWPICLRTRPRRQLYAAQQRRQHASPPYFTGKGAVLGKLILRHQLMQPEQELPWHASAGASQVAK